MDSEMRRTLATRALIVAESTDGWDWILPPVRSCLQRMVDQSDGPREERSRLGHELLRYVTTEPAFAREPLGLDLVVVAGAFRAP